MTGTITLSDGGQNYIEFDIYNNVIEEVRPARLAGWIGTKVLNDSFAVGGRLLIDLQWDDYDLPLKYPIIKIEEKPLVVPHELIAEGTATDTGAYLLIDLHGMFISSGVKVGDTVMNVRKGTLATIKSIELEHEAGLNMDIMEVNDLYKITRPQI